MKKTVLVLILCALALSSFSQIEFKMGLRGGLSSSSIKIDDVIATTTDTFEFSKSNAKVGFHFGGIARLEVLNLFVQPELLFSSTGGEIEVKDVVNDQTIVKQQKFSKIDIPIMLGLSFGFFHLQAGPIASYIISSKSELKDITGYEEKFNAATWGYQVGVGVDLFDILSADVKYEGSLSKLGSGVTVGGETRNFDSRNNQWLVSIAYFF